MNHARLLGRLLCTAACLLLGLSWTVPPATAADEADLGPGVSLTVYNQNFTMVKEHRTMQLAEGVGTARFPEVAATIVPESVQFSSLRPGGAEVLEQNYEFDLLSADKLLQKYLDREISVVGRDGRVTDGTLLTSDAAQLVLSSGEGIHLIPRAKHVKDIRFSSLPEGLLTRPTLVWKVRSRAAGEHLVKIAYRANAMNWRADYRAVASADEKTLDLAGWVTINNQTGTTFKDAALKLMAGEVHVVKERAGEELHLGTRVYVVIEGKRGRGFEEKSFAEYHLYTLGRRTTLANAQTKQIELLKVEKIPVTKTYLYRPGFGTRVAAVLEFKNSKETCQGLGIPLPKGPFRVYGRDADGQVEFVGQDEIDHTPKDEPVRLRTGYAFDLVAGRVQTAKREKAGQKWNEQDWKITLHNHKDQPAEIIVEESLDGNRNWKILTCSDEFEKKDFRTLRFAAEVPANGQKVISYTVRYTW